jgi:hypothetical protein
MFWGCIPSILDTLLQLDAPTLIVVVKIVCLVTSLTFELELLVSYRETHIPTTDSLVAIASFLRIKESSKQDWKVGFARTFSITNFLLFGLGHLNNSLWMHCKIIEVSLFSSLSTMISSTTPWAKMMSPWHNANVHFASRIVFCLTLCVACLFSTIVVLAYLQQLVKSW